MRKRVLVICLTAAFVFLTACGKASANKRITSNGAVAISAEEAASYITKVELTTENWTEHLDTAGALWTAFDAQKAYFDQCRLELTVRETGETLVLESGPSGSDMGLSQNSAWFGSGNFSVEDVVCTKAEGDLYLLNAPEEVWSVDESGNNVMLMFYEEGNVRCVEAIRGEQLKTLYEN